MRRSVVWFVLAVLAFALSGCSGSGDEAGRSGAAATSAPSTPAPSTIEATSTTTTTMAAAAGECGLRGGYPEPWPERPRYRATLDVDPEGGHVSGQLTVRFTPPQATDRLVFRLWANAPRMGSGGGRLEVTATSVDGEPAETGYEDGGSGPGTPGTIFNVFGSFEAGKPVTASLDFDLRMPGPINERVAKVGSSLRLGSILPLLAWVRGHGWHVSPGVSAFSEAVASEVADYDVRVAAPPGFTVLATGEEVSPGRFRASAVRDWAATVGRMHVVEAQAQNGDTRVVVGVAEGSGDNADARLDVTVRALEDFAARFGPYPYPVLSVGVTGSLSGGIEFPQHIHLGAGTSQDHLVHEVAHMWFYALVGNDQYEDPWLDEGLTEYAETRFLGNLAAHRAQTIPSYGRGRAGESHAYWARDTSVFYRSVYVQGAQALAAAGDVAGGLDAIDCALRRFVLDNAYSVARPDDLFAAMAAQTGVDPAPALAPFGIP